MPKYYILGGSAHEGTASPFSVKEIVDAPSPVEACEIVLANILEEKDILATEPLHSQMEKLLGEYMCVDEMGFRKATYNPSHLIPVDIVLDRVLYTEKMVFCPTEEGLYMCGQCGQIVTCNTVVTNCPSCGSDTMEEIFGPQS